MRELGYVGRGERNAVEKVTTLCIGGIRIVDREHDAVDAERRHFYIKAMVEKSLGDRADWKAVDAAMLQAAACRSAGCWPVNLPSAGFLDVSAGRIFGVCSLLRCGFYG